MPGSSQDQGHARSVVQLSSGLTRVPDLSLYHLLLNLYGLCGELDADGRLGLPVELLSCETREKVGLPHARVTNEDHCRTICVTPANTERQRRKNGVWGRGYVRLTHP